jgi:hypothetical protein
MTQITATQTLTTIANTLVATGKYPSPAEALRALALDQINRKISLYERRVRRFEKKHRTTFEKFSRRLHGRASLRQEDEWLEWEAAVEMLAEWRKAKGELLS